MSDLQGKKALVCGASQGIGRAAARELALRGCQVAVLARTQEKLESLISEFPQNWQHRAIAVDISDRANLKSEVDNLLQEWGSVEILVCNSGGPKAGPLLEAREEEFLQAFNEHVLANTLLVKSLVPGMQGARFGRIINIISTSVKVPIPNLGVSNIIRAAVASWAKTLAMELGPMGITVNNVLPGYTKTPRLEALIKAAASREKKTEKEIIQMWEATIPLRRFADPIEVAKAIGFLASPGAAYISGINLPVDGGRTGCL